MMYNLNLSIPELENLLQQYGSPLYIYDKNGIESNANNFMKTFRNTIPNFKQYFAVKALSNVHILKLLYDTGMGFDCSGITEIDLVRELNTMYNCPLDSLEIMFTANYVSVEDFEKVLKYSLDMNILINLDDIDGLENLYIASQNTHLTIPEFISFRLNPLCGKTDSETKSNVLGGVDTKFGIPVDKIVDAYKLAQNLGISKFGIHVMTGSCILDIEYFKTLINALFETINLIYTKLEIIPELINLGGGIGIAYKPNQNDINLEKLVEIIQKIINENKTKYNMNCDPIIAMENGRYITGHFGYLVSKCVSIKHGYNNSKFYGLDASMTHLMRPALYNAYHHITIPRLSHLKGELEYANVVGSLCENNDWFCKQRSLPRGIQKGDIFVIHDVGSHSFYMGNNYNGKLKSAEVLINIKNKTHQLIRNKETKCFE